MDAIHPRCAGIDVHKRMVMVCALWSEVDDTPARQLRSFGTTTPELEVMAAWLAELDCRDVAMEATGIYWRPIHNVLERAGGFQVTVANAEHMHAVPGRKTDAGDAQWIAELHRHGLLRPSFIPTRDERETRDLTRYRTALIHEKVNGINRLQKALEAGNIKLASVLSDITGASGQRILSALAEGPADPDHLAQLADVKVKASPEALAQALTGQLSDALRFLIGEQLQHLADLDASIDRLDVAIAERMRPFADIIRRLDAIPGVGLRSAQVIVAEIGTDMSRFPSHRHLAAWGGVAPANRKSAGKHRRAPTRKGNPWLYAALTAAAAGKCKDGYLPAQLKSLTPRLGRMKAIVAVAHSILVIVYEMIANGTEYRDLGGAHLDERKREAARRRALRQLHDLGFTVELTLTPQPV
jgi:transposase